MCALPIYINTIMKANAGGFLSTDREKSPQKLFFLCGVPVEKNHTRDVEWRGTAMGVVPTTIIPPRTTRPFIVRPVLQRLVASIDRASLRSEKHTSELQPLMRNSYAVFCLKN